MSARKSNNIMAIPERTLSSQLLKQFTQHCSVKQMLRINNIVSEIKIEISHI